MSYTHKILHGKLYTQDELDRWRDRALNGIFKTGSDAYEGNFGYADGFAITASNFLSNGNDTAYYVLLGTNKPVDLNDSTTFTTDVSFFARSSELKIPAFNDLIRNTTVHSARIKAVLLAQATEPTMDFSNKTLFPESDTVALHDEIWGYSEWTHALLKIYDFLDTTSWTQTELDTMEDWFVGAANWFTYIADVRMIGDRYITRSMNPIESVTNISDNAFNFPNVPYQGASTFWYPAKMQNNRRLSMVNYCTHVGVKFDIDSLKDSGVMNAREWISFNHDDNGYNWELIRSSGGGNGSVSGGLGYVAYTTQNVVEIAHILYHDHYDNLYEYKSLASNNTVDGSIVTGTVEKSLEWIALKIKENHIDLTATDIYPIGATIGTDKVMHYIKCTEPAHNGISVTSTYGLLKAPFYMLNNYFQNPLIEEVYDQPRGNPLNALDNTLRLAVGPAGINPSNLFQYALAPIEFIIEEIIKGLTSKGNSSFNGKDVKSSLGDKTVRD